MTINCLFIGNYKLKEKIWDLIVALLEKVKSNPETFETQVISSLLNLKVIDSLFKDFEDQTHFEREEVEYAKRNLKDSNGANLDGIPRKDIEKLVYAKRALILQQYTRF